MALKRLLVALALVFAACSKGSLGGAPGFDAGAACEDRDHDGYGRDCARGYDCDDDDPRVTTECRTCSRPERGCACEPTDGPVPCFLEDRELEGGDVLCSEGTRHCRDGVWSGCEEVHQYIAAPAPDTQRVLDPNAGKLSCSLCDVKCFQIVDHLLADGGVAGGNVTFGPGGGITLLPGDGGAGGPGTDAGGSGLTGCAAMMACCSTLSDALKTGCEAIAMAGNDANCDRDRLTYCPPGPVTGPVQGCTLGSGADTDCDGIPNDVDSTPGKPIATTNNQTIFHQLDIGETGSNSIDISFKLRNADVYFLLDMTNTMKEERDNLIASLTTGNVINCAHLNQCCNRLTDPATKASCQAALATYTNRPNQADNQAACLTEQLTYCPGNKVVDCPDDDGNGVPDNHLKTQGVVGATRCLVGSSWFGAGYSLEAPIVSDPIGCSGGSCSLKYADRDEHLFTNSIDMTPDYTKVLTALQSMQTNGNWDDPEGGMMALYSVITGKGHYFGINRPSIPPRIAATQCPPNSFGYPCFRKDAVPIVVFFTDRPHHNGPPDPKNCSGEGAGCPYNRLSGGNSTTWMSGTAESSSDKVARFVPTSAETFTTAYNAGDVRGQYLTLVGDTRFMAGDYPTSLIGCNAASGAPDALIRFRVSAPPGSTGTVAPIPVNFHLTKNDVYASNLYGTWRTDRANDPSPATEFGAVLSVFRGVPNAVSSNTDLGDRQAYAIASGPDSTYLTYTGTTMGANSAPGFLGGISQCAPDGLTNQMVFTFRPTSNARIVVDASGSSFPAVVSLHDGLPSALPKNPSSLDGSSVGIANTNDTFASANAVPSGSTSIDGAYVERKGDTNVSSISADYTSLIPRTIYGKRTTNSDTLTEVTSTAGVEPGMELSSSLHWTGSPVRVVSVGTSTIKLSAKWEGDPPPDPMDDPVTDPSPVALTFLDTLVGCGVDGSGKDTVFKFNVATPRRVRIDTEGSSFDTVISLHDAPPPTIVNKNDVAGNATAPGYEIGEVNNASYTLQALGMGTSALTNTYAYAQCGAGTTSKDAVFRFTLNQPTHIALEASSSSFDPIVGLFSTPPGTVKTLSNAANNNDNLTAPRAAFDLGDIYGAVDTKVTGSDLSGMGYDWEHTVVGCGANNPGRDQIFKFTPLESTRARIMATPNGSSWNPVIAVFDDPPPTSTAITTTAVFDAAAVTLPDANCLAFSYHTPSAPGSAHTYAVCPTKRYSNDANARCVSAGMDHLASIDSAAEQSFIMTTSVRSYLLSNFHIGAIDPEGDNTFAWRDGTLLGYSNWASGEPNGSASNNKCAVLNSDLLGAGPWFDGKCTSSGASSSDNTYYICEDASPTVAPNEDAATAHTIAAASTQVVTGSTRRMSNDYNGATLLSACGGSSFGGDAVFKITTGAGTSYQVGVDSAGSSFNVVLGLFESSIDAAGYRACDAFGGSQLTYTLLANRTYYILVKGTALSQEGAYRLKFSNLSAPVASGTSLGCARATASEPTASLDVDVDANHTYYVVIDQAGAAFGKYDLEVHSLYRSRSEVGNASSANETGEQALALPDPYRSRITVVDTSTAGMSADYGNMAGGMCTSSPDAPDAVYKFTPSLTTNVTFTVQPKGTGLSNVAVGVFDGLPGTNAVTTDLNVIGNPNESAANAQSVPFTGSSQLYLGNTSAMSADVEGSLLQCGAHPNGRDAVFRFSLAKATNVEIDASGSGVVDPVINLFGSGPLSKPTQVTLENDTKQHADSNPTPTPNVSSSWLYYGGDLSNLSAESQAPVSLVAVNDDTPPGTLQPQDLGDVSGKRVVISGGDTGPMRADYPALTCGGVDGAADALYRFTSSTGGTVHVKATPQSGFDAVIGLFDGTNGLPARLSDQGSLIEDTACVPPSGPKNLTNTTLKSISTALGSAPAINLNCGVSSIITNDPDGAGPALVAFDNWCGTQPKVLLQQQPDGPELVIVVTNSFQIANGSKLRVLGARPVLFVVNGTANIAGQLSLSPEPSVFPGVPGAGGDSGCGASYGGNALSSGNNSGGGGGGGFATAGGVGGFGSSVSIAGGTGGAARTNTTLVPLVGGCSGGDGAFGSSGGLAAGAVQISATTSIVLAATGSIAADGGAGSLGASGQAGGSGGGSGGAVMLQAPTVTYMASQISARGGNGGGGVGTPTTTGGTGATTSAATGGAGQNSNAAAGGGGGGGGYGRVVVTTGAMSLAPCTTATNESASSAWLIPLDGSGREYIERGNTSTMTANHGGMCGTNASAPDAVYSFSLSSPATVQIDARASANGTAIGLFNASSLGESPTPLLLENDDRAAADANPAPTPNAVNTWLAYRGDLQNLTASSQPQTTVDNSGNANEIIPTELPDPIDRRITITNANTSMMSADFLAPTCSVPAADNAPDAIYRFVPSKSGPVRVSANYSQTAFDPVIALYRGAHEVIDERVLLVNQLESTLAKLNVDVGTIKVYNLARTVLYTSADYTVVARDGNTPVVIKRSGPTSAIPPFAEVSVDYVFDAGAPLPISQQQMTQVNLSSSGNSNESGVTAQHVPIESGRAYVYTGDTTAMSSDVDGSLFTCGPPALGSPDATFEFSLDKTTTVSITTEGSAYDTTLAVFSSAYTRPSTSLLRSPAPVLTQLYDARQVEGAPESGCTSYEYASEVYWFCSTPRTWEQAEGMCQGAGLHLVTIDNQAENDTLYGEIQATGNPHHIGFAQTVPYTNSWGAWSSGGGGTEGSAVSGRFNRWAANEPNGSGDCLQMLSDGTWDDADCALVKAYVCERNDTTPTPAPTGGTCGSAQTYNGHLYYACTDAQDWATASGRCTSVGMRLARIDDLAENDQLRGYLAGSPAWIGGSDSATEGTWVWADNAGFWLVTAYRNWADGEPNQFLTNPGSRMRASDGKWEDTPFTSQPGPYICENPTPPSSVPQPPTAGNPQNVDVFSALREFTGSTEGVMSSVAGFINGCTVAPAAPDAVFQFELLYQTSLSVDISGSFAGAVVGLFRDEISAQGYQDAGSRCGVVAGAAPQLTASLSPGIYYAVITGTTAAASGVYHVRFDALSSDPAAFTMENDTLADAVNNPLGSVDGQWLVKKANMADLTPTLGSVTPLDMGAGTDTNDVNPQSLGVINDTQVIVTNASTGDLTDDYPGGSCNAGASGADALYSFEAASDEVQIRFAPAGWSGQVVLFDGVPATSASGPLAPISLAPGYSNEAPSSAQSTPVAKPQAYLGNLTMMTNDVPADAFNQSFNAGGGSPLACSADAAGSDAFFKFTVSGGSKQVEISSAGSSFPHTIALWDSKPFSKPAGSTVQYDALAAANMAGTRLGTGDDIDDDWVVVRGNTSMLVPYLGYTTFTESVDYPHDDSLHMLGDVKGQEIVTVNASTTGLAADYLAATLQCGGLSDAAPDAVFSFTHSTGGRVRLSLNNPTPAFAPTMSLFGGEGPLTEDSINPPQIPVTNTNEAITSAFLTDPVATSKIYTGSTSAMLNNYPGSVFTQGSAYGSKVCTPEAAGRDAFVRFVLSEPKTVEISSLAASFNQTIALWDSTPVIAPTATAMSHDTRSAAFAGSIGAIDDTWTVKTATMSGLMPDAVTALTPTVANNDEVQDLGNPVGRRIAVSGNTSASGVLADFTAGAGAAVTCGSSNTAPDIIYKVRPTANTTIRAALNNPSAPSFNAAIAVLNGSTGQPKRIVDTTPAAATTTYCGGSGFGYTPSNFTVGTGAGEVNFASAPTVTLGCGGTLTFNSSTRAWSSFCSQTQPAPVVKSQSGGPDLVVLPFKSLTLNGGTTIKLVGNNPVVFAVEGNAEINGVIDANASGTTPGAGGNQSCGSSAGGGGNNFGLVFSGAGGGGFGTAGGKGDDAGFFGEIKGGAGGSARGTANLVPLLGGCNGGDGSGSCTDTPGAGGGAVQISAGGSVTVGGTITANGAVGGHSCGFFQAGGHVGGGSGGAILLEGTAISAPAAKTLVNGGNSSSGAAGSTSSGSNGANGGSSGSGGGGYGRVYQRITACKSPNETPALAPTVPIGLAQTYTGPNLGMTSDLAGASFNVGGACAPDAAGADAFWKFTLTRTTNVEISAQGTNHLHTLTLFNSSMVAQACNDGTIAAGGLITRTLTAGTYYVGLKTRGGSSGGNFTVRFRDTAAGAATATSMGCATTSGTGFVDASLTANTDYYIIVKGASGTLSGSYNLTVTDLGQVQAPSCGDPAAPDAYFDFQVTNAGRDIRIELNETAGKLDGSFQLMRDAGTLNNTSDDVAVGGCQTSGTTYTGLAAGRYYVIVRGATVPGTLPAEITIKDQSGSNALDCADANSGAAATITRSLPAGTYYVGITSRAGGSAGGSYRIQIRDTAIMPSMGGDFVACADEDNNLEFDADANVSYYVVVKGLNAGSAGAYTLTATDLSAVQYLCDPGDPIQMDPTAPDAYYAFNVTDADGGGRDVTVSLTSTSALDGAYRLFRGDGTPIGSCHDRSAPFTYTDLPAGNYFVVLRGKNVASGGANAAFELSFNDQDAYGSLTCADGTVTTGTSITRTLSPGDYYVGIKPQAGAPNPKEYRLQFRDTAEALPTIANEIACGTNLINASVTPGTTYYVLVKGNGAMDSGDYGLTVTDLGGSSAWDCGDDPAGGDAYFEFNVNDPDGRRVTIDTESSQLDTVVAIFPAGQPIDASGVLQCDDDSGATTGSSKITRDLLPGVYYAVVRPKLGAADPTLPFELSIRDESVYASVACGATSASGKAKLTTTLGPGTYHTVLKGMAGSAQGAYKIRFRDETPYQNAAGEVACNDAQNELVYNVTAGKPYYAVVKGAATNQSGAYRLTVENMVARNGMGCNANAASPDAVYRFHLSQDTRVQIDTIGSQTSGMSPVPTDTVIALYDTTASYFGTNYANNRLGVPTTCDDNGADAAKGWSKIVADLAGNRDYYVVVKSKSSGWGGVSTLPYVVNVRDLDTNQPIACASTSSSLLMTETLQAGDYRLVVSTLNGTTGSPFDVRFRNVTAASSGATQVACADSPEEFTYNVVAGRPYYLMVKGDAANDRGQYNLVVETAGTGATSMGCGASPAAPDAFFKFQLAEPATVVVDTENSSADTVIALYSGNTNVFGTNYALDVNGVVVPCDDDGGVSNGASRIQAQLAAGTYYVVVKGKTAGWNASAQAFNLSIRDLTNTGSIACASSSEGSKRILQNLQPGDYQVVMSTASATGGAYSLKFRDTDLSGVQTGSPVGCVSSGSLTVNNLAGGREYYVVVKGDTASDAGGYTLTMEDTVSLAAASGSTSVACAAEGMTIDGTYPAGTYYALVTGRNPGDGGPYTLKVRDVDALQDQNRLACDDNSGPNNTSVIERDLKAGTHYVVVKGNGENARGAYTLHIRDKTAVPDRELACGGSEESERLQADVKAGQDYTVVLKGESASATGAYDIKLYDQHGLGTGTGQNLKCLADPQPTNLVKSNWHRNAVDFDLNLTPDTYYVAVKGVRASDKGKFQLNIGEKSARTTTTWTPPTWTEIQDALSTSAARVLPVIATGGETDNSIKDYISAAEAQAQTIAIASKAQRKDGSAIWQKIHKTGRGTGSGLITGIAELADYLAMDVSLVAIDGPDPGASKFRITIAPVNSPSCAKHPLVDTSTGACTPRSGALANYSCNTQYQCAPGSAPKFSVTFTNPSDAPVPPNPNDPYGGYHFRLQIIGDKQYLLDEVPVYIIPTTHEPMGPPGGGGMYQPTGTYEQDITSAACPAANDLPQWSDMYFNAALPEGTSLDMELCTKETVEDLASCVWSDGGTGTRKRVRVSSKGTCASDAQCRDVDGFGDGFCAAGTCQFIDAPKVAYDIPCTEDAQCPNGALGAGEYLIGSRCETTRGAFGYGYCVYSSQPADMGATLLSGEQGRPFARVRFTLRSDSAGSQTPTLYQWNLTYYCKSAQ